MDAFIDTLEPQSVEVQDLKDMLRTIAYSIADKQVVSFGDAHNDNKDTSVSDLLKHSDLICEIYKRYAYFQNINKPEPSSTFVQALTSLEKYSPELASQIEIFRINPLGMYLDDHELINCHPSRIFAKGILPLGIKLGFTDLVLEGLLENDPHKTFMLSKDRIGTLMILTAAMLLGYKIHEANVFTSPIDTGDAILKSIQAATQYPAARVLVFNGAMHNMTIPFKGEVWLPMTGRIDVSKTSYAPALIGEYGDRFKAIDLFSTKTEFPPSRFATMKDLALESGGQIVKIEHGKNQTTFFLNPK